MYVDRCSGMRHLVMGAWHDQQGSRHGKGVDSYPSRRSVIREAGRDWTVSLSGFQGRSAFDRLTLDAIGLTDLYVHE